MNGGYGLKENPFSKKSYGMIFVSVANPKDEAQGSASQSLLLHHIYYMPLTFLDWQVTTVVLS